MPLGTAAELWPRRTSMPTARPGRSRRALPAPRAIGSLCHRVVARAASCNFVQRQTGRGCGTCNRLRGRWPCAAAPMGGRVGVPSGPFGHGDLRAFDASGRPPRLQLNQQGWAPCSPSAKYSTPNSGRRFRNVWRALYCGRSRGCAFGHRFRGLSSAPAPKPRRARLVRLV